MVTRTAFALFQFVLSRSTVVAFPLLLVALAAVEPAKAAFVDETARRLPTGLAPAYRFVTGDIDNDGHVDLLQVGPGGGRLLINNGSGDFADASVAPLLRDGERTINAAMVDGQPVVNEANYADLDGDGVRDDPSSGDAWANNDHMLETWGSSRTLVKRGSIVHLQFADMSDDIYNNTIQPHEVAWSKHAEYQPPRRDYGYDPAFAGMAGQPPFAPLVSKLYLWQEITP